MSILHHISFPDSCPEPTSRSSPTENEDQIAFKPRARRHSILKKTSLISLVSKRKSSSKIVCPCGLPDCDCTEPESSKTKPDDIDVPPPVLRRKSIIRRNSLELARERLGSISEPGTSLKNVSGESLESSSKFR